MHSDFLRYRTKRALLALLLPIFAALASSLGFFERLDHLIYDLEITVLPRPANDDIVIVAVDERSVEALGQWPWPRRIHAQLIRKLTSVDPRAIGIDMLFVEPDFDDPVGDNALVEEIRRYGKVVLPVALENTSPHSQVPVSPWPALAKGAAALGHVRVEIDRDGVSRGVLMRAGTDSQTWPAFAKALRDLATDSPRSQRRASVPAQAASNRVFGSNFRLIPFASPTRQFRSVSFVDLLWDADELEGMRNKVVIVGTTAPGIAQRFPTPGQGGQAVLMSGVEFNANVLAALLDDKAVTRLPARWTATVSALIVLATVLGYGLLHSRKNFAVASFFAILTIAASCGVLRWLHVWFAPASALLTLALIYPLWTWQRMEQVAASLSEEKERARATLHAIGDALVATDAEGMIDYMNPVAQELAGCNLEAARGRPIDSIFTVNRERYESNRQLEPITQQLRQGKIIQSSMPYYLVRRDGKEYAVRITGNPIRGPGQSVTGMVFALSDITEILQISRKMAFLSTHDPLTELPNRVTFQDRLGQGINNACRFGTRLAVMFVDLDGFKKINDGMGHIVGDLLLKDVGGRLRNSLRLNDTLARWGGDEFVIMLEHLASEEVVSGIAVKIIRQLSEPFYIEDHEFFVTPSIGISLYPKDGMTPDSLLARADAAMYRVKESGRNNFHFFSRGLNEWAKERLVMEKEMHYALKEGGFEVFYQPKIHLATGRIIGAEALLRWRHPQKGLISPALFVPLAEEVGLINPLGNWVLHDVCRQVRSWHDAGLPPISCAVNLSPRQFMQNDLSNAIQKALAQNGLDPGFLQVEITESLMIKEVERITRILNDIKALGVSISIDDFGTGYSSLSFLKRFPIDELKIDKSFIRQLTTNPHDANIAQALISLAHNMQLRVVAEGVETRPQLEFLKERGCDVVQGYYFSHPLEADDFSSLLSSSQALMKMSPTD